MSSLWAPAQIHLQLAAEHNNCLVSCCLHDRASYLCSNCDVCDEEATCPQTWQRWGNFYMSTPLPHQVVKRQGSLARPAASGIASGKPLPDLLQAGELLCLQPSHLQVLQRKRLRPEGAPLCKQIGMFERRHVHCTCEQPGELIPAEQMTYAVRLMATAAYSLETKGTEHLCLGGLQPAE